MKEAAKYKRMHEDALDLCKRYIVHLHNAERERDEARADVKRLSNLLEAHERSAAHCDRVWGSALSKLQEAQAEAASAYRRGAEAMREACANCVKQLSHEDGLGMGSQRLEGAIRTLPIPEEP